MAEFFATYGLDILSAVGLIVGIVFAGLLAWAAKKNTTVKTIVNLAERVVLAVEQAFPDMDGSAKMEEALGLLADLLAQNGIKLPVDQMVVFLEAAVGGFNKVFNKEN